MIVVGLDPGPERSALVALRPGDPGIVEYTACCENAMIHAHLSHGSVSWPGEAAILAVEMVASYGMPVGADVFDTCVWIGRFIDVWPYAYMRVRRLDAKLAICQDTRAKDKHLAQALYDRWGGREEARGSKKAPGPLYEITNDHLRAALAVALTVADSAAHGTSPRARGARLLVDELDAPSHALAPPLAATSGR